MEDTRTETPNWAMVNTDSIIHAMERIPEHSLDCSIYSPPFPAMYAYNDSEADLGNVEDLTPESLWHFKFFFSGMLRVMKPGRVMVVHCCQIPRMKRVGGVGMHDFRGMLIRLGERAGFIYEYDWAIRKNPQSQAIRTRSRELQFSGLERDRAKSRGAIPDYLIKFIAPGVNAVPIRDPDDIPILDAEGNPVLDENGRPTYDDSRRTVSRNDWINWAEPAWMDIRETDTLKVRGTKEEDDTRHICPLQLPVIDRLVKLFSNPGETVFSPFAGIGSEGVIALRNGRKFLGCELKKAYYLTACANLRVEEERIAAGIVLASEEVDHIAEAVEILDAPEFDDSEEALPVDEVAPATEPKKRGRKPKAKVAEPDKGSMVDPMPMSYAASDGVAPDDGLVQPSFWDSLAPGAEPLTGEDLLNDWERRNGLPVNHAAEADAFDELVNAAVPSSESDPLDSIDDDLADLF